jgi:hypothetical protein
MDRLGKIRKMNLIKSERGEWKGECGRNAAKEDVNKKKRAAKVKTV